jgi:hypothetical protein
MNMRVVLVAPEFPPANTAAGHRPRLFAKHLPAFGWTPTVLTMRPEDIEGPIDPTLESLVAPALDVVRTAALRMTPVRITGDPGLRTLASHGRRLSAIAAARQVDALVLFGPPWFSFVLGPWLKRRRAVPYIVDYIDPWISDWTASHRFPSKGWLHHRAAAAIEPGVLRQAAHITAVSPGILEDLRLRYRWLAADSMTAMPYGAEPEDIAAAVRHGIMPPDFVGGGEEVTIAFTGALQPTGRPLMGAVLRAISVLRDSGSPTGRRLRLRAYGTSNLTWGRDRHSVVPMAREMRMAEIVSEIPERVPYLQALAILNACDIVLVTGSTDAYYHASKLYPAIVSGRPILALCHAESSIRCVIEETAAGSVITFRTTEEIDRLVPEIARAIERLATAQRRVPDSASVERYTARASTRALAGILDKACGRATLAAAV